MDNLILGLSKNELTLKGGIYTANEISGQPELWLKTWNLINKNSTQLRNYLHDVNAVTEIALRKFAFILVEKENGIK